MIRQAKQTHKEPTQVTLLPCMHSPAHTIMQRTHTQHSSTHTLLPHINTRSPTPTPCHVLYAIRFHRFATSLSLPLHPSHPIHSSQVRAHYMYDVGLHAFLAQQSIAHLISSAIMMFMFCETRLPRLHCGDPLGSEMNARKSSAENSVGGGSFELLHTP